MDGVPFEVLEGPADARALIICDHASRHVPPRLDNLGLEETLLYRHIAWDIGAGDVARRLARLLRLPAILCGTSRLVIDCNRPLDDASSIPEVSDGIVVPGNQNLPEAERQARIDAYFRPYHDRVEALLAELEARNGTPAVISVHSFAPLMGGIERPWHVGLLWDHDTRMVEPVLRQLKRNPALRVGENEPYNGWDPRGYSIHTYGETRGLPMCVFEIRQDLVDTHHGAEEWAHMLAAVLRPVLADDALYRVLRY